jgi:hypothetical protein
MKHKICISCNRSLELTVDNFKQRKYIKKSGVISIYWAPYCIECQNNKTTEWHQNNKERCRENEKRYRLNHAEVVKKRKSAYKKKNKDKISEYNRNYRAEHKAIRREQDRKRRQNDIAFRLRKIISRSVQKAISKNGSITKYLPYSFQELKSHLEKHFEPWMTWQNHGSYNHKIWDDNDSSTWTWQIDHIVPQSTLLYSSMNDANFQKCWALDNLRPLSAKQNVIDGASRARHQ